MSTTRYQKVNLPNHTHTVNSCKAFIIMDDEFDMPTFAFHDLDYVPWGVGGVLAP